MSRSTVCFVTLRRHDDARLYEKEALSLRKQGCPVLVICPDFEGTDSLGVRFIQVDGRGFLGRLRLISAAKKEFADYYHVFGENLLYTALRLKNFGKVVYEPGLRFPNSKTVKQKGKLRKLYALVTETQAAYERYKPLVRRTTLLRDFPVEPLYSTPRVKGPSRHDTVCRLGELSEEGGVTEVLEAASLCGCKLVFAGDFLSDAYEEQISRHPAFSSADRRELPSGKKLWELLTSVNVGVVTPKNYGDDVCDLPGELYAFLAAGVPVVSANSPAFLELIEKVNCGVCVDPSKPEEISASVDYLLKNPDVAAEMGMNGRRAVMEKYNWNSEVEKLLRLYRCSS